MRTISLKWEKSGDAFHLSRSSIAGQNIHIVRHWLPQIICIIFMDFGYNSKRNRMFTIVLTLAKVGAITVIETFDGHFFSIGIFSLIDVCHNRKPVNLEFRLVVTAKFWSTHMTIWHSNIFSWRLRVAHIGSTRHHRLSIGCQFIVLNLSTQIIAGFCFRIN